MVEVELQAASRLPGVVRQAISVRNQLSHYNSFYGDFISLHKIPACRQAGLPTVRQACLPSGRLSYRQEGLPTVRKASLHCVTFGMKRLVVETDY